MGETLTAEELLKVHPACLSLQRQLTLRAPACGLQLACHHLNMEYELILLVLLHTQLDKTTLMEVLEEEPGFLATQQSLGGGGASATPAKPAMFTEVTHVHPALA
jgi:hypothetical protein